MSIEKAVDDKLMMLRTYAFLSMVAGLVLGFIFESILIAAFGLGIAAVLWASTGSYKRRKYGIESEKRAVDDLKLPKGWSAMRSVLIGGKGDADLVIINPEGKKFIIEIKSNKSVSVVSWIGVTWFGQFNRLKLDSRSVIKDPIAQVIDASKALYGNPIVWFPEAKNAGRFSVKNVRVVIGGSRLLKKEVGIRSLF